MFWRFKFYWREFGNMVLWRLGGTVFEIFSMLQLHVILLEMSAYIQSTITYKLQLSLFYSSTKRLQLDGSGNI